MDLRFDLHSAKYDAYRKLVRFVAMDGSVRIKCAVTLDALAHVEGRPVPDRTSPTLYKKHVEKLHQIIVRKYRANQFDAFDRIMISPSDIDISRWQSANLVDVESPQSSADVGSTAGATVVRVGCSSSGTMADLAAKLFLCRSAIRSDRRCAGGVCIYSACLSPLRCRTADEEMRREMSKAERSGLVAEGSPSASARASARRS